MFKLKKQKPPFGTSESPIYEAHYSEGSIRVIDGVCEVKRPEAREYLRMIGYEDFQGDSGARAKGKR